MIQILMHQRALKNQIKHKIIIKNNNKKIKKMIKKKKINSRKIQMNQKNNQYKKTIINN